MICPRCKCKVSTWKFRGIPVTVCGLIPEDSSVTLVYGSIDGCPVKINAKGEPELNPPDDEL